MPATSSVKTTRRTSSGTRLGTEKHDTRAASCSKDALMRRESSNLRAWLAAVCLPMLAVSVIVAMVAGTWMQLVRQSRELRAASLVQPPSNASPKEVQLQLKVETLEKTLESMKHGLQTLQSGWIEEHPDGMRAIEDLQDTARALLIERFGSEPYRIAITLGFTASLGSFETQEERIIVEMAPATLMPYSVYRFLEIVQHFRSGAFVRYAPHVLQAKIRAGLATKRLAFQEYSSAFPHLERTLGFVRHGGSGFYISLANNTINHGPGSQQQSKTRHNPNEADACFGKVIEGWEDVVLSRMPKQFENTGPNAISDSPVKILNLEMLKNLDTNV